MKKLIFAALLVVGVSAFAQDQNDMPQRGDRAGMERMSPEQRNEAMLKRLTSQLDLNSKQQEQLKEILAEQTAKREAMRADRKAAGDKALKEDRTAMREKMMAEQKANQEKIKSILTPAQITKWEAIQKQQQERRGAMGWNREGGRDRDGQGPGQGNDEN